MSQGFKPVNLPHQDEAPVESLTITSYKAGNMEDNVGDAGATEVSSSITLSSRSELKPTTITTSHLCYLSDLTI